MPASVFNARRGGTVIVPLEAFEAADADLVGVTIDAGLKRAGAGLTVPPAEEPRIATFVAPVRPSTDDIGPGWNLMLSAEQTAELEPGDYVTDAVITLPSGAIVITAPLIVRLAQGVSR